jgi:hypothetical protein
MLPPAETADDVGGGGVVEINILPVRSGTFILSDDEALRHPELRRVDDKPKDAEPWPPASSAAAGDGRARRP